MPAPKRAPALLLLEGIIAVFSADIGLPQLAMHSSYETAGVKDALYLADIMTAYYGISLEATPNGCNLK